MNPAADLSGQSLLVLEDEYLVAHDIAHILSSLGADVVGPFSNLADAQAAVEGCRITGAILDINMQGERVYEIADRLAERRIPFVFASGYRRGDLPARFRHVGLCEKPCEPDTMVELLKLASSAAP